jgi:hypothetical protein
MAAAVGVGSDDADLMDCLEGCDYGDQAVDGFFLPINDNRNIQAGGGSHWYNDRQRHGQGASEDLLLLLRRAGSAAACHCLVAVLRSLLVFIRSLNAFHYLDSIQQSVRSGTAPHRMTADSDVVWIQQRSNHPLPC